jgi:hypothetical protein
LKKRYFLKSMVIGLCLAGFCVNLSAILIWFQYGLMYAWSMEGLATNPNYMDVVTWSPPHSPIILHTKALVSDYVTKISPQQYLNTAWSWAAYGTAPCKYDLYIYCNLGILPLVAGGAGLVVMFVLISGRVELSRFARLNRSLPYFSSILAARKSEKSG